MAQVKRKPGRPAFKPTVANRRTVEQMVAMGDNHDTIARALGIVDNTLRLHFEEELKNGYSKKRAEYLAWMHKFAAKGNATLIKRLEEMSRMQGAAADFEQPTMATNAQPKARGPKLGKKEVQREEAMLAGVNSEWGEDLAPLPGTKPN